MWFILTWDVSGGYTLHEEWFQPVGFSRDTFRGYTLKETGWPFYVVSAIGKLPEDEHNMEGSVSAVMFEESLPGELAYAGDLESRNGSMWLANENGMVIWREDWGATYFLVMIAADVTGDKVRDLIVLGTFFSPEYNRTKRAAILDIRNTKFYRLTVDGGYDYNASEIQVLPYKNYYVVSLNIGDAEATQDWVTLRYDPATPQDASFVKVPEQDLQQNHPMNIYLREHS